MSQLSHAKLPMQHFCVLHMYFCLVVAACAGHIVAQERKPNIILIMADDLGYGDVGFRKSSPAVTPCIDAMAASGLVFNRFYAQAPVCSPTRGSVLTGRHPYRYGVTFANVGRLPEDELNLVQVLQQHGYRTGHFGKWHLGSMTTDMVDGNRGRPGNLADYAPPWLRGFDVCFSTESKVPTFDPLVQPRLPTTPPCWNPIADAGQGRPFGTRFWNERGQPVDDNLRGSSAKIVADRAIEFIRDTHQTDTPFLAVIWFHEPHLPVVADEEYRRPFMGLEPHHQHYFGCIRAMDEQIGRIRAELRSLAIERNTIVCFTSDNGPERFGSRPGSTGGLRGRKRDLYEGGIRVPAIIEWPGRIEAGETDFVAVTSDFLPTFAALLAITLPAERPLDGVSLVPVFTNRSLWRDRPIGFQSGGQIAVIEQRYKVIDASRRAENLTWANPPWNFALYDLIEDPFEQRDISAEHPEVVQRLTRWAEDWHASLRSDYVASTSSGGAGEK